MTFQCRCSPTGRGVCKERSYNGLIHLDLASRVESTTFDERLQCIEQIHGQPKRDINDDAKL